MLASSGAGRQSERPPNEDLAVLVALGRVDHVQTGIQRAPEESRDRAAAHPLVADLGAAEAENASDHIRLAEPALLHRCYYLRRRERGAAWRPSRRTRSTSSSPTRGPPSRRRGSPLGSPRSATTWRGFSATPIS